jgi:hypothetical protein
MTSQIRIIDDLNNLMQREFRNQETLSTPATSLSYNALQECRYRQTYHLLTVATLPKVDNIKGEGRLQRTLRNIPLTTLSKYDQQ